MTDVAPSTSPRKPTRRRWLRWVFIVAGAIGVGLILIVWLARSDPRWYRKLQLTEAELVAAERRIGDRIAILRNDVGRAQVDVRQGRVTTLPAFEVEIAEDEVNAPLARWSGSGAVEQMAGADPEARKVLSEFSEPHVRFLPGRIELAARSTRSGALLSIELTITQAADGSPRVTLGRPWAGRLPLARGVIEGPVNEWIADVRRDLTPSVPTAVIDCVAQLVAGDETEPVIAIPSSASSGGWVASRVEKLEVVDGMLRATIKPIDAPRKVR